MDRLCRPIPQRGSWERPLSIEDLESGKVGDDVK